MKVIANKVIDLHKIVYEIVQVILLNFHQFMGRMMLMKKNMNNDKLVPSNALQCPMIFRQLFLSNLKISSSCSPTRAAIERENKKKFNHGDVGSIILHWGCEMRDGKSFYFLILILNSSCPFFHRLNIQSTIFLYIFSALYDPHNWM